MPESVDVDPVDLEILRLLQNDSRITNRALAQAVGVAPSTCLDRVARLRQAGVIVGYTVRLDATALGHPLSAFLAIRIGRHNRELVERFVASVLGRPQVRALYHVAGPEDYLVHVVTSDVADLQSLVLDGFTTRAEVTSVRTMLVFQSWDGGPLLPSYASK
ncbi:MAG: Lrp/AsnC family transcriptional regulator [Kibdelosporangium sp.]